MTEENFDWGKFDESVDLNGLAEDVEEAEKNNNDDRPEIPDGHYEVIINNMELGKSKIKDNGKGGDPMLKIQFRIVSGEYKNNLIFYNGVMQPSTSYFGFQTHNNNVILTALGDGEPIHFNSFSQYNNEILDLFDDITQDGDEWHYELEQSTGKKGYKQYKILQVLD